MQRLDVYYNWAISGDVFRPLASHPKAKRSSIIMYSIYCISTINTQHIRRSDVLLQLGYIWRHISAFSWSS